MFGEELHLGHVRRCRYPALYRRVPRWLASSRPWVTPRFKLVAALCVGGAFSIAQLTATTDIIRQGVTTHLKVLADAGVVRDVCIGRERLWQLDPTQIEEAKQMLEVIGKERDAALGRLKLLWGRNNFYDRRALRRCTKYKALNKNASHCSDCSARHFYWRGF